MEIIRLQPDTEAPSESDCIKITALADGRYGLVSSALFKGDSDGDESVAVIGGDAYASFEAAEAAGVTWADEQGVETLYVERFSTP